MLKCNRCGRRCNKNSVGGIIHNVIFWVAVKDVFNSESRDAATRDWPDPRFVSCRECLNSAVELLNQHFNGGEK
jgi:hypothetical protein